LCSLGAIGGEPSNTDKAQLKKEMLVKIKKCWCIKKMLARFKKQNVDQNQWCIRKMQKQFDMVKQILFRALFNSLQNSHNFNVTIVNSKLGRPNRSNYKINYTYG
jgi:hypothetical protein